MNLESFLSSVWPTFVLFCTGVWNWCKKRRAWLAFTATLMLLVYFGLFLYQTKLSDEIVVLTAARGTSSWRSGDDVASAISRRERFPGVNYSARAEMTSGAEEIKARLQSDTRGNVIAYYFNDNEPPDAMRVLLPLDYDYLHIVCRTSLISERPAQEPKYQFRDVQSQIQPGKVFAGPAGSETRILFDKIFKFYWKNSDQPEDFLNPAIGVWVQARSALRSGQIDVVFFMAPFGTDTMFDIAGDQKSVLLGLNDFDRALVQQEGNAFLSVTFPPNSYSAATFKAAPADSETTESSDREFQFCCEELATIATRRLMVCSTAMRRHDAYTIAAAVRGELESDSPQIGEAAAAPVGLASVPAQYELMKVHPGALMQARRQTAIPILEPGDLVSSNDLVLDVAHANSALRGRQADRIGDINHPGRRQEKRVRNAVTRSDKITIRPVTARFRKPAGNFRAARRPSLERIGNVTKANCRNITIRSDRISIRGSSKRKNRTSCSLRFEICRLNWSC